MIFTQFRGVATALTNRFAALKKPIPSFELNGGVKIPDRVPLVKEWGRLAEAGDARPIICSWAVAGVGLNMTAANNIITIDKTFVPAQHAQGYARARRIGQKYPVIVHELIMKNTIEQRIERILKTKTGLFGTLINQDDVSWKRKLLESLKDDEQEQ